VAAIKGLLERDEDFVRWAVQCIVQAAPEAEMTEALSAEKGEREPKGVLAIGAVIIVVRFAERQKLLQEQFPRKLKARVEIRTDMLPLEFKSREILRSASNRREGRERDPGFLKARAHRLRHGDRIRAIAVDTDAIDASSQALAGDCNDCSFQHHGDDALGGIPGVLQHRVGARPCDETAGVRIGAIGVDFAGDRKSLRKARRFQFRSGGCQEAEARLDRFHRARNGQRDRFVLLRDIAQGAMNLHIAEPRPGIGGKGVRGAELIGDEPLDFSRRERQSAAAEPPEIGKSRMRSDRDPLDLRRLEGLCHDLRIASMKAAGDIGARHNIEHGVVVADPVSAEPFAAIAIQIDAAHGFVPLWRRRFHGRPLCLTQLLKRGY
jgi:hypothetical protein